MIGNPGIDSQVAQRVDAYQGNPQGLMQQYSKTQQLVDLLALQQLKTQKEAAAKQKMLQMAQAQGQPGTIAEQREKEVLELTKGELSEKATGVAGILAKAQQDKAAAASAPAPGSPPAPGAPPGAAAGLPTLPSNAAMPAFAQGGIIAFKAGDPVVDPTELAGQKVDAARKALAEAKARLGGSIKRSTDPAGAKAAQEAVDAAQAASDAAMQEYQATISPAMKSPAMNANFRAQMKDAAAAVEPPSAPPVDASTLQGAGITSVLPPVAVAKPAAAQPRPQPKPPVAAALPPPPPPAAAGLPQVTVPPDPLTVAAEKAAMSGIASDPLAQRKAAQAEAFGFTKRTPEEEAGYKDVNEKQAAFDAARFGSGTNWEKIAAALAGGAGHSTLGLTGAGVTTAGLGALAKSREDRNAALKSDFERMDKYNTGSQAIRQKAVESGGAAETAAGQRQGNAMQAATAIADTRARTAASMAETKERSRSQLENTGLSIASAEKIADLQYKVMAANAKAAQEGNIVSRAGSLLNNVNIAHDRALKIIADDYKATGAKEEQALGFYKPDSPEYKQAMARIGVAKTERKAAELKLDQDYAPERARLTAILSGGGSAPDTGGIKVVGQRPAR
jgi:hypothetical protein